MAAPAYVSQSSSISQGIGGLSVPWPAHSSGNIGILVVETSGDGSDISISGWTHVPSSPVTDFADATGSKLHVLYKIAASGSESNAAVPDNGDHQIAAMYVFSGIESGWPIAVSTNGSKTTASLVATLPSVTTPFNECLVILVCGRPNDDSSAQFSSPSNPNLSGLANLVEGRSTSGNGGGFYVLQGEKTTAGSIGTTTIDKGVSTTDTYIVFALAPVGAPPPPSDGYVSSPGPLSPPYVLGTAVGVEAVISVPSVLSPPFALSEVYISGIAAVPSILSAASLLAFSDFSTAPDMLRSVDYYACDIVDGANTYRVKISSWQATLQLDASNYLQAVIPACDQYMDILTGLSEDAEFVIIKGARLSNGTNVENELARAPVSLRFDQGPQRHTCTMSGYSDAFTLPGAPTTVTDRVLRNVRSSSTDTGGRRFRCAIDWFLRPGQTAIYDEQTMLVSYMNYYVTMDGQGDAYMDVGERI